MKFKADEFVPSKWDTAADKARFCNAFVRFVEGGFKLDQFPETFYRRLSSCFGHIAHFNRDGFYETFFTDERGKLRFLEMAAEHACYGQAEFSYSDAEMALRSWVRTTGQVEAQLAKLRASTEASERARLRELAAKYPDEIGAK
jgi:hypothetical protein